MPPTTLKPPHGDAAAEATRSLTRLEAHAAVRLDAVSAKLYDRHGLPLRRTGKPRRHGFSLMKSVKGLASYLTTRINPSFQECLVRVVEYESDLAFEVRQLVSGKGVRGRLVFTAPLSSLVDVVSDSVIERDTVVFAHLPSSYASPPEGGTLAAPVEHAPAPVSRKEELISTLFSAYGDIGLHLVFRAALTESERGHRTAALTSAAEGSGCGPLTRVGLRFVSAEERNEWMSFCAEAYMGLLLDSIRTDRDAVFVHSDGDRGTAAADPGGADARVEKPSEEAVECYIDFFLSASARADSGVSGGGSRDEKAVDPLVAPQGGVLKVRDTTGAMHSREVAVEHVDEVDSAGLPVSCGVLVVRRRRWSGKCEVQRIALDDVRVYAEDDGTGSSFYLEFPCTATPERTLLGKQLSAISAVQRSFLALTGGAAARDCVTVECEAGSFSSRRQWLQWLEAMTKRPVLYLSVVRREAEAPAAAEQGSPVGLLGHRTAW